MSRPSLRCRILRLLLIVGGVLAICFAVTAILCRGPLVLHASRVPTREADPSRLEATVRALAASPRSYRHPQELARAAAAVEPGSCRGGLPCGSRLMRDLRPEPRPADTAVPALASVPSHGVYSPRWASS